MTCVRCGSDLVKYSGYGPICAVCGGDMTDKIMKEIEYPPQGAIWPPKPAPTDKEVGKVLTWGFIKKAIEEAGVKDEDPIFYFDLGSYATTIHVSVKNKDGREFTVTE